MEIWEWSASACAARPSRLQASASLVLVQVLVQVQRRVTQPGQSLGGQCYPSQKFLHFLHSSKTQTLLGTFWRWARRAARKKPPPSPLLPGPRCSSMRNATGRGEGSPVSAASASVWSAQSRRVD